MTQALELAHAALAAAEGVGAEAVVQSERSGFARFAGSEVHQPTLVENETVQLRVVLGDRVGVALTNRTSGDGLRELARRARESAESAEADPLFPGLAEPRAPADVGAFDQATARLAADEQAHAAAAAIEAADGFPVYGYFTSGTSAVAVASSTGVAVEQESTDATVCVLAATDGASGWAEQTASAAGNVDPAAAARQAVEKAERTRWATAVEPGRYAAVLEPSAVADLLQEFGRDSFGALGLLEERSYLTGRLGSRIFDEKVSVSDDALDPRGLVKRFDFEGVPKQRVVLVDGGIARGVVWDRLTAALAANGHESTGHAPPAVAISQGPEALALSLAPGEAESPDELAALVGDGLYVTRLHYLGLVNPREGVITGMTRDGTFRIRDGRVAEPLMNLRFTVSVADVLGDVPALTRDVRLVNESDFYEQRYPIGALVPALATRRFNVTGVGSGPGL